MRVALFNWNLVIAEIDSDVHPNLQAPDDLYPAEDAPSMNIINLLEAIELYAAGRKFNGRATVPAKQLAELPVHGVTTRPQPLYSC